MIFKIKKFFLLIFLILLQACSGSRIGNFLETSFDDLENKRNLNQEMKERKNNNIKVIKKEDRKNVLENKKLLKKETKERKKKDIKETKKEDRKDVLENKQVLKLKKTDKTNKTNKTNKEKKVNRYFKKTKNDLQSYKIIFILKDVDPKDPIEELSTILRNSEVNFEIEKIERFHDLKK